MDSIWMLNWWQMGPQGSYPSVDSRPKTQTFSTCADAMKFALRLHPRCRVEVDEVVPEVL